MKKKAASAASAEQSREIKKRIIEILKAGQSQAKAAEATGTTRQYVSYIAATYRKKGDAIFEARRGRRKDRPLTEAHLKSLHKTITGTKPTDVGMTGDAWTETLVQNWFRKAFDRTITRHQIRRFCMTNNLRLKRERPLNEYSAYLAAEEEIDSGSLQKEVREEADFGPFIQSDGTLDLEGMQASVAVTQAMLAKKGIKPVAELPGVRTGKHSKQRRAPFTPKKKRKN